jgi:hypothetical protein
VYLLLCNAKGCKQGNSGHCWLSLLGLTCTLQSFCRINRPDLQLCYIAWIWSNVKTVWRIRDFCLRFVCTNLPVFGRRLFGSHWDSPSEMVSHLALWLESVMQSLSYDLESRCALVVNDVNVSPLFQSIIMCWNFVLVHCQFVFSEAFNCLQKERLQIFSSFLGSWQRWLEEITMNWKSCSNVAVQFFVGAIHEKKG